MLNGQRMGPPSLGGTMYQSWTLKLDEQDSGIFTGWSVATVLMQ